MLKLRQGVRNRNALFAHACMLACLQACAQEMRVAINDCVSAIHRLATKNAAVTRTLHCTATRYSFPDL